MAEVTFELGPQTTFYVHWIVWGVWLGTYEKFNFYKICCVLCPLLSGYPFALFQRYFLFQKDLYLIHLYNTFTGLSLAYFNFGKGGWEDGYLTSEYQSVGGKCDAGLRLVSNPSCLPLQEHSSVTPSYVSLSSFSSWGLWAAQSLPPSLPSAFRW